MFTLVYKGNDDLWWDEPPLCQVHLVAQQNSGQLVLYNINISWTEIIVSVALQRLGKIFQTVLIDSVQLEREITK